MSADRLYFGSDLASGQVAIARGPLYAEDDRPQLSGHETFPLRYGWLKKAFDAVQAAADRANNNDVGLGRDSISRFGVGQNMVAAMRHWATAGGIIMEASCYVLAGALAYQRSSGPNYLVLGLQL